MRLIGMSERALELMCERALTREAFGGLLAEKGTIQADIAESRAEIEQCRSVVTAKRSCRACRFDCYKLFSRPVNFQAADHGGGAKDGPRGQQGRPA